MTCVRRFIALIPALATLAGCYTPDQRIARSTALEQQVTSVAVERAIGALGVVAEAVPTRARLRVTGPEHSDLNSVREFTRARLADLGVRVVEAGDEPLPTVDVHVRFAGSDQKATLLGFPIALPGVPIAIPDLSLWKATTQYGRARLSLSVWNPDGERVLTIPEHEGACYFTNWTFLTFIGPFRYTDIDDFDRILEWAWEEDESVTAAEDAEAESDRESTHRANEGENEES